MANEGLKWKCNAYPDQVEILKDAKLGQAVALQHSDCTELIIGGVLGEFKYGSEEQRSEFNELGVVGIYVPSRS